MRCALGIVLAIGVLGSAAHADDTLDKARLLAARGRAFHDGGDYAAAITAYDQAYALAPRPGLLFNLAQAYRLAGNCARAADLYRRYLATDPTDDRRELARRHLDNVEHCHTMVASLPTSDPMPAPEDDDATPRDQKRVGTWLAIGGGSALVLAAAFAIDAHLASDTVDNAYKNGKPVPDLSVTAERGQQSADIAAVLGISGGVAMLSGAVLYAIGVHSENARRATVVPTAHGAQVQMTWQW